MSLVKVSGNAGGTGTLTIAAPNTNSDYTLTLPQNTGTLLSTKSAGTVLQVLQSVKSNVFSTSTTGSWVDVTDVAVTITPSSTSNKIFVSFNVVFAPADTGGFRIVRDSTPIGVGDSLGSNTYQATSGGIAVINGDKSAPTSGMYLDSPATTSATTYKVQVWNY